MVNANVPPETMPPGGLVTTTLVAGAGVTWPGAETTAGRVPPVNLQAEHPRRVVLEIIKRRDAVRHRGGQSALERAGAAGERCSHDGVVVADLDVAEPVLFVDHDWICVAVSRDDCRIRRCLDDELAGRTRADHHAIGRSGRQSAGEDKRHGAGGVVRQVGVRGDPTDQGYRRCALKRAVAGAERRDQDGAVIAGFEVAELIDFIDTCPGSSSRGCPRSPSRMAGVWMTRLGRPSSWILTAVVG